MRDRQAFRKPVEIPTDDPIGRCGVAVRVDGSLVVSWLELVDDAAEVRVCLIDTDSGEVGAVTTVGATAAGRAAGVPEIAAVGDRTCIVAWRDVSKRQVMTARVSWK